MREPLIVTPGYAGGLDYVLKFSGWIEHHRSTGTRKRNVRLLKAFVNRQHLVFITPTLNREPLNLEPGSFYKTCLSFSVSGGNIFL